MSQTLVITMIYMTNINQFIVKLSLYMLYIIYK